MKKSTIGVFVAALALIGCGDTTPAGSQETHPEKAIFASAGDWPTMAVGEGTLANFEPFRAVYERVYRDGRGEERRDRVIITAERVAWNATPAISVSLVDAGNSDYDDTAMRVQNRVFAVDDHRMLLYITPVPGTPRDYMIAHTDGELRMTMVEAASGEATVQKPGVGVPQLGAPALWLIGSARPTAGQRFAFANADAPAPSNILGARPLLVSGTESVDAGPLGSQEAQVVIYPLGMTNARVMRNFVIDRPPYLVGKIPIDLDSGEASEVGSLRLISFTSFGGGSP